MRQSIALLFPGQGSQESGMGRTLAEQDTDAMALWKKAEQVSGLPLRAIYWEGNEHDMADTRAQQPALTAANLALWLRLSRHCVPSCGAGHSVGEYSALAAAGVLAVDKALSLVSLRGRLMAEADPQGKGGMTAILKLAEAEAEQAVALAQESGGAALRIANYNTPGQFVASGAKEALAALPEQVRKLKGRALPLPVSGAFHSPLMQEAAEEMAHALRALRWQTPRFPIYPNVDGRACANPDMLKNALLIQMTSSVRWSDTIRNQWTDGVRCFVECGPKGVLAKMVKPNLDALPSPPQEAEYRALSIGSAEQADLFCAG